MPAVISADWLMREPQKPKPKGKFGKIALAMMLYELLGKDEEAVPEQAIGDPKSVPVKLPWMPSA